MVQLTPEHFELHDSNKAKRYEQKQKEKKQKEKKQKDQIFFEGVDKLNKLANAYDKATDQGIKEVYKKKWFELVKIYANKI